MSSDIIYISEGSSHMMIMLTYLNSPLLPQSALSTPLMTAWATRITWRTRAQGRNPLNQSKLLRAKSLRRRSEVEMVPELVTIVTTKWSRNGTRIGDGSVDELAVDGTTIKQRTDFRINVGSIRVGDSCWWDIEMISGYIIDWFQN